jgi:hypothetical protein
LLETMKRKATILFAVTLAGGTAAADPVQPRTLQSGAPACGNMLGKYGAMVSCAPDQVPMTYTARVERAPDPMELGRAVVQVIVDEAQRIQAHVKAANTRKPRAS